MSSLFSLSKSCFRVWYGLYLEEEEEKDCGCLILLMIAVQSVVVRYSTPRANTLENIYKIKCNQMETSLFNNLETAPRIATS